MASKESYVDAWHRAGKNAFRSFLGWGISTLLLWLINRHRNNDNTNDMQPSKYTNDNTNSIGSAIPVAIGRVMIKNPLVSLYGDYDAQIYTEEYGAHSGLNVWPMLLSIIIPVLIQSNQSEVIQYTGNATINPDATAPPEQAVIPETEVSGIGAGSFTIVGASPVGPVYSTMNGTVEISSAAKKRALIINAFCQLLLWLLMQLINKHLLRTTIQKGFKYYLGWQNILCWTGDNIGIKRLWMNVYDSEVEDSTEKGVWGSDNISWKKDNPKGIVAHIDQPDMFGGYDEGGGFVGDVRFYFGTKEQGRDSWMVQQMTLADEIPADLKGLTPVYPMYFTVVVPKSYIGKQATIPEMWFEVVNYPSRLRDNYPEEVIQLFADSTSKAIDIVDDYLDKVSATTRAYLESNFSDYFDAEQKYKDECKDLKAIKDKMDNAETDEDKAAWKAKYDAKLEEATASYNNYKDQLKNLRENYPATERDEFNNVSNSLYNELEAGVWHLGRLGDDENPAEAIYEILMNENWGCNYEKDRIDIPSLVKLGAITEIEGLGVSCLINNIATAGSYINKILDHINGVCYDDPKTGKLTFKLLRDNFDENELPIFNTTNCESLEFTRLDWSETSSAIQTTFTSADNKFDTSTLTISDISNTMITKNYTEVNKDCQYFTTPQNARTYAQTQLLSAAYPLAAVQIKCNRIAYDLTVGDPIIVNWKPYGIVKQVFRVTDIDYASLTEEEISITAVEDVFSFGKVDYEYSDAPQWTTPIQKPKPFLYTKFIEMPYEFTKSLDTYVYCFNAQTSSYNTAQKVWRYQDAEYKNTTSSTQYSTGLKLVYGCDEVYGTDSGITCEALDEYSKSALQTKMDAIADDTDKYNNGSALNLLLIDDEICSYDDIKHLPDGNYMFTNVIRGVYDTLPKKHTSDSIAYLLDYGLSVSNEKPACKEGETSEEQLEVTATTKDKSEAFDKDKVTHLTTTRRGEQPSVMANLKFGADRGTLTEYKYNWSSATQFSYNILFNYLPRNKFSGNGIVEQTKNIDGLKVPTKTKYSFQMECNDVSNELMIDATYDETNSDGVVETKNVTTGQIDWAYFCKFMDNKLSIANYVNLKIYSYDSEDKLYSHDYYEKTLYFTTPRLGGIVTKTSDVQKYADSIVDQTTIIIPESTVSPILTMNYEDCCMIFVGVLVKYDATDNSIIRGQDGNWYHLTGECYRIDGSKEKLDSKGDVMTKPNGDTIYEAIIHKIDIDEEFVFRTNFTQKSANTTRGYKYRSAKWIPWTFY